MTNPRVRWLNRATTVVPLAGLGLAISMASGSTAFITPQDAEWLTPHTSAEVAGAALSHPASDEPASVTDAARASASQVGTRPVSVGDGAIPDVALRAYQRAEVVIAQSDSTCGLQWELLAAIGKIESDHGRHGKSRLNKSGRATPAIIGVPLNGNRGTLGISDTDAGQLDGDQKHDRAVGPMQFIPSTWSVVGVDADGDGRRDPQDIDDAALAAAVHLCGGAEDLSTAAGLRAAVLRYNRSSAYVDQVVALQEKYLAGKYNAAPTAVPATARPDISSNPDDSDTDTATHKPRADKEKKLAKPRGRVDTDTTPEIRSGEQKPTKPNKGRPPVTKPPAIDDPEVDDPKDCIPEEPPGEDPTEEPQPGDEPTSEVPEDEQAGDDPADETAMDETEPGEGDEICPVDPAEPGKQPAAKSPKHSATPGRS